MDIVLIVIWGLVILSTVIEIPHTMERVRLLKEGVKALIYLPVVWVTMIMSAVVAVYAADQFPILNWGWLGYNAITVPVTETLSARAAEASATGVAAAMSITEIAMFVAIFIVIAYACMMCNYYEELYYRNTLFAVVVWACIHIIMGIPIFLIIPIFYMGLVYKYVHDKHSLSYAYCLHFFTNLTSVMLLAVVLFMS